MRVWICIAYDPLPGIDRTTRLLRYGTLAEELAANGHSVVMWTSTFDHWRKIQRFDRDETVEVSEHLQIELIHAPAYARNISWSRIRHNRVLADRFRIRAEKSRRPDVIFAGIPCLELTESVALFAQDKGIPLNVDVQDIWPEVYVSVLPRLLRSFGRIMLQREFSRARKSFQAASAVTAVSQVYLDWAVRLRGGSKPGDKVFHLGYKLPPLSLLEEARNRSADFPMLPKLQPGQIRATFLGQFAASYDIATIVHAARLLESRDSRVQIVLAGAGDKFAAASRSARNLRSVVLTGWLEYLSTIALLQQSHIGLAAYSRRASQSLPYKPFEYMAFGLPIISSLRGELRDLIDSYRLGESYQAGDAPSLARAIQQLALAPLRREEAGRNARALYDEQFEAGRITRRLMAHLEALAATAR